MKLGRKDIEAMLDAKPRSSIASVRHRSLAGGGHMGPVTHAEAVNSEVLAFVDDCARMAA